MTPSLAWRIYKDSLPVSEGSDPTIQLARQDGIYQLEVEATDEVGRTTSKRLTIVMEGTEAMDSDQWKNAFRLAPVHATHTELAIMEVIIIALMCIGWLVFRRNRVRSQKAKSCCF